MLAKGRRLHGEKRFSEIFNQGQTWVNPWLMMKGLPNNLELSRFAFAVGKSLGGAVVRNRWRRRLAETVRLTPVKGGWDIIMVARRRMVAAGKEELQGAVRDLLSRAQVLE